MSLINGKDATTRKSHPLFSGVLAYFPDALLAVAELSKIGNDQHNPGQPLHWSRGKSNDHADCLVRHQLDAGTVDSDGVRHATKVAWRALAQLQLEIEAAAELEPVAVDEEKVNLVFTDCYRGVERRKGQRRIYVDAALCNLHLRRDGSQRRKS